LKEKKKTPYKMTAYVAEKKMKEKTSWFGL